MPANRIKLEPALVRRYSKKSSKRGQRQLGCKILIVCEGEKTEPNYFNAFKAYNHGTFVYTIDVKGIGQNTIDVVNKAIELKKKGEYDRVWAVFDKDSFSSKKFNGAIIKARQNGIDCAWSNEAFELWYLYHFVNRTTAMNRSEYQKAISKEVNKSVLYKSKHVYKYMKNDVENYNIMNKYGSMKNAIKYAESNSLIYNDEQYANHNPCTMVYLLVKQLIGEDDILNQQILQSMK